MKFRNMIFVMTIAFSVIFVSMLGTSYAYYVATDGTSVEVITGNIDTGVAVVFSQSEYINVYTSIPINPNEVNTKASSSTFVLTPDPEVLDGSDVAVNVGITDFYVDNALVVDDFKYRFSCNDGTRDVISNDGDGTLFTEDVIESGYLELGQLSTDNDTFNVYNNYTCTLSVWIEESGLNQNMLMNKKFRGLIKVNTLFRK